jgi:hypothetical protein
VISDYYVLHEDLNEGDPLYIESYLRSLTELYYCTYKSKEWDENENERK